MNTSQGHRSTPHFFAITLTVRGVQVKDKTQGTRPHPAHFESCNVYIEQHVVSLEMSP